MAQTKLKIKGKPQLPALQELKKKKNMPRPGMKRQGQKFNSDPNDTNP
jgi:hypothetical protein